MLELFNTLTRMKEEYEPLGDVVGIYTCGPSVYQYAHIGNFRTFIFEDVLVRYLRFKGYKVKRVMNITDIEDKAISVARKEGKTLQELTDYYSKVFFEDMEILDLLPADVFPKATEHIPEIIGIIKKLMQNGYAYRGKDGYIYYDVSKFASWGKLSHLKLRPGKKKIKRDEWGEESAIISDFAVWKAYEKKDGEVFWETELGKGRPGWHIECSAMGSKYLGTRFDMHIGGVDNIYPHHETVIAQSFGAFGDNPSRYWLHSRHLMVNGKKMSKSANNYYTIHDLLERGFKSMAIKYLLLSKSHRKRLNFTFEGLIDAEAELGNTHIAIERLKEAKGADDAEKMAAGAMKKFLQAMDDNIDTGKALEVMKEFRNEIEHMDPDRKSSGKILETFRKFDTIFGLGLFE